MEEAPERFPAAVLIQPVGLSKHMPHNTPVSMLTPEVEAWVGLDSPQRMNSPWRAADGHFVGFARRLQKEGASDAAIDNLYQNMFGNGRNFVFTVTREWLNTFPTPLLVLMGMDQAHPTVISREIALLAPNATLVEDWKRSEVVPQTMKTVEEFMLKHVGTCTPAKL